MTGLISIVVFIVLLVGGLPILFALGGASFLFLYLNDIGGFIIVQRMMVGLDQFVIMAVPMFILAGNLMSHGGTTTRLVNFAKALVGHLPGGLAHVNVVVSMLFAGMSGAAAADVSALGPLEIEMMEKGGYDKEFSTAVTISSSVIGPIIPPSLPLVVYGVVASTSIGGLFLAGIIPGIFVGIMLMLYIAYWAKINKFLPTPRASLREFASVTKDALGPLGLPLVIVIGMYSGKFTPTEAAAIACIYAFVLGLLYKELHIKDLPKIILDSAIMTATALSILGVSNVVSYIFASELVPVKVGNFLVSLTDNRFLLLIIINVAFLFLGCFMETLASIALTVPIFLPIVLNLGMHPIHFGVVVALNLTLGLLTPPVGLNLYIASAITKLKVERIIKANMPFLGILILCVLIITFIPQLTMFLPTCFGVGV